MSSKIALFLTVAFACAEALAGQPDPKALAKEHFERGVDAYSDHRFADAAQEFNLAYQLSPAYAVLYNIAQVDAAVGNSVEAVDAYEKYLVQAGTSISDARRKQVIAELETQRSRIGTLALTLTPAGAEVRIDGKLTGKAPLRDPVRLAAGKHSVTVLADGYTAQAREVEVLPREQTELDLRLEPMTSSESGPAAAPVTPPVAAHSDQSSHPESRNNGTPQPASVVVAAAEPQSDHAGSIQRGLGYAVGGLGIALVASGGVLALVGASQASTAENRMTTAQSDHDAKAWDIANADYGSAKSRNQLGLEGVGLGAAFLLGGGLLVLTAPSPKPVTAWSVAPFKTGRSTGLVARVAW
jgi:hypothetical protein